MSEKLIRYRANRRERVEDLNKNIKEIKDGSDIVEEHHIQSRKNSEIKIPRNRTNYSDADYNRIFNIAKDVLQLQDIETRKLYEKNISTYLEGLLKRLKSSVSIEQEISG